MGRIGRRLPVIFVATVLVVAAFSTGITVLFFLVYLAGALVIGSWWYARRGLNGVRAGYHVLNPRAQVGEVLHAVYRIDNDTGWSKPWLEVTNDSSLPVGLPGRVIGVRAQSSRQWLSKVSLTRRGTYRIGAVKVRTGDPFGLFTSEMMVGRPTSVVVFPKVFSLPHWRLPPAPIEGSAATRRRREMASPLAASVRPYAPGDAINRIHWLSSMRHGELLVKEFDPEQAADLWMILDLERAAHVGTGDGSSVETAVSVAASIAVRTLADNRAVGLTASARRAHVLTPDRGSRVEQKILHLLANVQADGVQPLAEVVAASLPQFRRGTTVGIVTGSTSRDWVRPLASLPRRGVGVIVVLLDLASFAATVDDETPGGPAELSAVRHALAEYGIANLILRSGDDPERVLVTKERVHA
ncbi:MAG TPA: DUF58 domain-containing protein [Candidatus Limnocylindria bacterium]|jgi:uncharacterized protein (DUF58 family)